MPATRKESSRATRRARAAKALAKVASINPKNRWPLTYRPLPASGNPEGVVASQRGPVAQW